MRRLVWSVGQLVAVDRYCWLETGILTRSSPGGPAHFWIPAIDSQRGLDYFANITWAAIEHDQALVQLAPRRGQHGVMGEAWKLQELLTKLGSDQAGARDVEFGVAGVSMARPALSKAVWLIFKASAPGKDYFIIIVTR